MVVVVGVRGSVALTIDIEGLFVVVVTALSVVESFKGLFRLILVRGETRIDGFGKSLFSKSIHIKFVTIYKMVNRLKILPFSKSVKFSAFLSAYVPIENMNVHVFQIQNWILLIGKCKMLLRQMATY